MVRLDAVVPAAVCLPLVNKVYHWLEGSAAVLDETVFPGVKGCVGFLRREIVAVVRFEADFWMTLVDCLMRILNFIQQRVYFLDARDESPAVAF